MTTKVEKVQALYAPNPQHTLIEIGIMIEQRSSNRRGITKSSYHGPSSGCCTYHSYVYQKIKL